MQHIFSVKHSLGELFHYGPQPRKVPLIGSMALQLGKKVRSFSTKASRLMNPVVLSCRKARGFKPERVKKWYWVSAEAYNLLFYLHNAIMLSKSYRHYTHAHLLLFFQRVAAV